MTQDSLRRNPVFRFLEPIGQWLTAPSPSIQDPEQRRQAQLLSVLHVLLMVFGISAGVIAYWGRLKSSTPDLVFTLAGLGVLVLAYVIGRTRHFRLSAMLTIGMITLTTFALALPDGDSHKAGMLSYLVIPVLLSSMLLSFRTTAILIGLQTVGMLAFYLHFNTARADDWIGFVLLISVMILLGTRYLTQVERARQARLAKTENRYRVFVENVPVGVYRATPEIAGTFVMANPAFVSFLGYESEEDLKNVNVVDIYAHPADRQPFIENLLAKKNVSDVELHLKRKDGTLIWGLLTAQVVYDEDNGPAYYDGAIKDITGYKQTEAALRESEAQYRELFEGVDDAITVHDLEGNILDVNEAACRRLGYTRDELLQLKIADLDEPGEYAEGFQERVRQQLAYGKLGGIIGAHFTKDGRRIDIESNTKVISYHGQQAVLAVVRDITERIQMAEQVRQERDRAQQYLDIARVMLVALNEQGEITLINRKGREILGCAEEELIGQNWFKTCLPAESADHVYQVFLQLMTGETVSFDRYENPVVTKSGEERLIAFYNTLLHDPTGQVVGTLSSGEDITERRLAEDAVRKSEAMLAKAQKIAHLGSYSWDLRTGETAWSDELRQILGITTEPPSYERMISMIHPDDRARVFEVAQQTSHENELLDVEYRIIRADGTMRYVHDQAEVTRDATGKTLSMFGSVLDITERKLTEAALREQRALAEALRDIAAVINISLDPERVFDRILMNLGRVVPHDFADIMMLEAGIARVVSSRSWLDYDIDEAGIRAVRLPLNETATLRQMAESGRPCMVPDTHAYPGWVNMPETRWVRSYIGAPIRVSGEVIGFINVNSTQPNFFTDEHVERLQAFADQVAIAINNARSYDDLERRVIGRTVDLSVRNAVAETLSNTLEMTPMLNGVLHTTVERLGVLGGAIYLLSDDGLTLSLTACHGVSADTLQLVTGIVPGGADRGVIGNTPHIINDVELDIPHETGIFAVLSVPIWHQGQVQGVITLVHDQVRPWRAEETRMLDAIGRQIGVALVNARLYTDAIRDEAHLRTILQSVADGLLVFDQADNLILMNPAAEALFSFYPSESGGARQAARRLWAWLQTHSALPDEPVEFSLPVSSLMQIDRTECEEQCPFVNHTSLPERDLAWPCWLQLPVPASAELRRCPVSERIPRRVLQAHSAIVRDADDQVLGMVIALHDITYFRELDDLKGRFVSTVSHELRTPLSVVLLQVSTLIKYYDRLPDGQRREMIGEIQQQAHVLRELIEDILELSRFDARRSMPQKQWFDLASHCDELLASLEPSIREKHLHLEVIQDLESSYIHADPQQVMRVLRNVVSNAIKYTPEGGRIALHMEQVNGEARLSVSDTGIGIAPDEQLYIFDRFYRAERAARMAAGTGLGLSITKEIVDLHGGRIELFSTVGEGSTFVIYLPVHDEK